MGGVDSADPPKTFKSGLVLDARGETLYSLDITAGTVDHGETMRPRRLRGGVTDRENRQIAAILHHLADKRLSCGGIERVDDALNHLQPDDLPDRDDVGERQHGEQRRLDERSDLRPQQNPPPVVPIDETLRRIEDLGRQGKVRYVGLSNYSGWHTVEALWHADRHG